MLVTGEVVDAENGNEDMSSDEALVTIGSSVLPNWLESETVVGCSDPVSFDWSKDCCEAGAAGGGKKDVRSSGGTGAAKLSVADTGALSGEPCSDLARRCGPKIDCGSGCCSRLLWGRLSPTRADCARGRWSTERRVTSDGAWMVWDRGIVYGIPHLCAMSLCLWGGLWWPSRKTVRVLSDLVDVNGGFLGNSVRIAGWAGGRPVSGTGSKWCSFFSAQMQR